MYSIIDVLGDEGRKARDACVKVKIIGKPENIAKYRWDKAWERIEKCYPGGLPNFLPGYLVLQRLVLPTETAEYGRPNRSKICNIIDIYNGMVNLDEMLYVEKYPKPGPGFEEKKKLIDERRADVNRECQKARANPEARHRYSWLVAQRRVRDCYAGSFKGDGYLQLSFLTPFEQGTSDPNKLYDIFDIYHAVECYDKALSCDPRPASPHSFFWKKFGAERKGIEREIKEASSDCGKNLKYSSDEACGQVKNCYEVEAYRYGGFKFAHKYFQPVYFGLLQSNQTYNIFDIQKAVQYNDEKIVVQKYPEDDEPGSDELKKSIVKNNFEVKKEYEETKRSLSKYSQSDAEKMVRDCLLELPEDVELFSSEPGIDQMYDIFDIHKMLCHVDADFKEKHLKSGTNYENMSTDNSIQRLEEHEKNRDAITMNFKTTKCRLGKYSWSEAERRARDCFVGTLELDTDIFFHLGKENTQIPKSQHTYDIFDIKKAIDHFDIKKLCKKHIDEKGLDHLQIRERNDLADKNRAEIQDEYAEATTRIEIEHGSGFIVHDHFIITNKHVIEDAVNDGNAKEIYISNLTIGELPCEIVYTDAAKDLALLYCQKLNIKQHGITPLHLSSEPLLPGMQIFSLGYPMSHTGETALFVNGHVSGSKEICLDYRPSLAVLNLSLNSGNSGGPVLSWVGNQLKIVGVATQKHFKEILTLEEREKIEKIRNSLQTSSISGISDEAIQHASLHRDFVEVPVPDPCQTPMFLLTLKLYDALETHSQFNLSNALPGHYVIEFIQETIRKYEGEHKDELVEVMKWTTDPVNILPSGHHSASDCCIQ